MKFIVKIAISWLLLSNLVNLQAAETDADEPRWFEVEVIVFKSNRSDGLFAESWDDKAELTKPVNLIDFLQPYQEKIFPHSQIVDSLVKQELVNDSLGGIVQNKDQTNTSNTINDTGLTASTEITSAQQAANQFIGSVIDEKPFQSLQKDLLQLSNEAKSLTRHPDYQVLFHQAWRQPILGSKQAAHIRIAGGQDFSEQYKYDGSKKIFNEQYPDFEADNENSIIRSNISSNANADNNNQFQISLTPTKESNRYATDSRIGNLTDNQTTLDTSNSEVIKFGNLIPELIPVPWVPELDGDIKIYLGRYLHIRTNLYLRRPDKEEVEVIDLNMFNTDMLTSLSNDDTTLQTTDSGLDSINSFQTEQFNLNTQDNQTPQDNIYNFDQSIAENDLQDPQKSQFSWEIDDNFLETESEKMYIERLFNYPVNQSRRVRSGELHFFDHPLVGVLILIRPYEIEKEESEVNQLLSPSR